MHPPGKTGEHMEAGLRVGQFDGVPPALLESLPSIVELGRLRAACAFHIGTLPEEILL
jgi:hypothetical protein